MSDLEATFMIIPPFLPHDQYARGVVVCCKGAVASLFAGFSYFTLLSLGRLCLIRSLAEVASLAQIELHVHVAGLSALLA